MNSPFTTGGASPPRCESGWTGDRCDAPLFHTGPHTNDEIEVMREWLEDQPGSGRYLVSANRGTPLGEVLAAYYRDGPMPDHTVRGELIGLEGVPYGTTHDRDCPGCDGPYGTTPRDEAYWSS